MTIYHCPPPDLSRLKDILDQARSIGQPFFIPNYHLEKQRHDVGWVHVHVYPIYSKIPVQIEAVPTDVIIIITQLPKVEGMSKEELHFNQELQILLEANREISGQLELKPTLEKVTEQIKLLLFGSNCQIYFLGKDNKTLRPALALGPLAEQIMQTPLEIGNGLLGKSATKGQPLIVGTVTADSEVPYPSDEQLLCAPLTSIKGTIGMVVVSRSHPKFTHDDLRFFENLVQQASSAINNARLFEETQRSLNELAILYSASTAIATHWDDQSVLDTLIQQVVEAMGLSRGLIASWNRELNNGFIQAQYPSPSEFEPGDTVILEESIDLKNRDTMINMLNQQRPLFLHLTMPTLDDNERTVMEAYGAHSRLLVPLMTKGETIGWMEMWETKGEHLFTADEVRLSRALSTQIAVALQNSNYMEQTQRTLDEATALYRVASALTTMQDPQAIITTVLQEYLQALALEQGSVILFEFQTKQAIVRAHVHDDSPVLPPFNDNTTTTTSAFRAMEGDEIPLSNNPVYERLMRTRQAVVIDNPKDAWLTTPPVYAKDTVLPPVGGWGDENAFAVIVIPIKLRGEIIGVIVAENTRNTQPFNSWVISLGQAMADQLGIGIQNVQLFESEYQRREQAETLREVSAIVSSSLNLSEVLERVLDQLSRVVKYDSAAIHLVEGRYRRVIAGRGFSNLSEHIGLTYPTKLDETEPGSIALHSRKPIVYGNISNVFRTFERDIHSHIQSWMGIPLIARDKVIGLISIDHSQLNAYAEEDVQMAEAFANQVAVALENARLHEIEVRELERELEIAQQIQTALLSQVMPQIPGLDIAGRIVPARQVGGDFYHFFSTEPDQLGVAIGDVSGKGIPAALYMAAGITAIDTQIGPDVLPGELLNKLNQKLYNRLQENKMNIALQIATFIPFAMRENGQDASQGSSAAASLITVASAGMIAPIGATEHGCRTLPVGGLPIGALPAPEQVYNDDVFLVDPFTTIIFTSDGIVEAQNQLGEMFGFERLEETILEIVGSGNAEAVADHIIDTAKDFMGDTEQHDDMTVVVVVKT